jgi:hypothetical protein
MVETPDGAGPHWWKCLSETLTDKSSSLNIIYVETFDGIEVSRTHIRPTRALFHGVVLGKQAVPIRHVQLPVTFQEPNNYHTETLTFEVVYFH